MFGCARTIKRVSLSFDGIVNAPGISNIKIVIVQLLLNATLSTAKLSDTFFTTVVIEWIGFKNYNNL